MMRLQVTFEVMKIAESVVADWAGVVPRLDVYVHDMSLARTLAAVHQATGGARVPVVLSGHGNTTLPHRHLKHNYIR